MIVAAHQPSFLPWLGYLDKMAKSDLFVVMDDLQYERQNFQNRNRIKIDTGVAWLTVPLYRGKQNDRLCDKVICNAGNPKQHWQRRVWRTIQTCYRRAPHFADYAPELEAVFARPWERLLDLDLAVLELARSWLGIRVPIIRSSTLQLRGTKTDRIVDMCKKVNARGYLTGSGGSQEYLDTEVLGRNGICVVWQSFDHPRYPQRYPALGFLPNLAFIDLVLNCGRQARDILFPSSHPLRAEAAQR
jgi:hypothetical protein